MIKVITSIPETRTYATKYSCASSPSDRSRTNLATVRLSCVTLSLHPGSGHMTENFPSAKPVPSSLANATGRALKLSRTAPDGQQPLTNVYFSTTARALQRLKPVFGHCHRFERIERRLRLLMPSFHSCVAWFLFYDLAEIDLSSNTFALSPSFPTII